LTQTANLQTTFQSQIAADDMVRLGAVSLLGVTLGLLTGCGSSGGNGGGGTTPPPPSTGSLTITVSELPSGASASITVSGPSGYSASVTSTQTLQVAPGSYTVAASSVSAGNSNYYPAIASQSATVAVSATASVTVDYATIIPKTTKAIDTAGKSSLTVSSDGSTITMSTSSTVAASLQPNDILASGIAPGAPNGLLVRILSVSTSGQTVTASVEPATLEEAIQQGTLQYSVTLDTTNTTSSAYLPKASSRARRLPGSRRLSRSLAQPDATTAGACAGNPNTLKYPYPSVPLIKTGSSSLTLLGESDFCPTLSLKVDISGLSIVSASANASLGVHNAIGVEGTYYTEFVPEYDFPAIIGPPIDVPIGLGPIVVTVQPTLTPFIGLSGSAYASAYAGITTDSTVSVGIAYANGVFTPSGSATPTVIQPSTSVDGQFSIKAYAGLKAGVLLYGTVTPYLSTDAYLKFEAGLNETPCWSLTSGVEANVGISGKALGKDFDYPTAPLNLFSAPVAQSNGTCFGPVLSTISPTTALAGSGQLTLAVTGSNFVPDSTVNWNGQPLVSTFVDTNDLTAVVPASDIAAGGTFPVTVNSPDSPGGTSAPLNFTVSQVMVTVSPATAAVATGESQQFLAAVTGTTNTAVNWSVNGIAGGNASVGTISASGLYTAPGAVPSPAGVTVSASSQDVPSVSGSARVTITKGVVVTVSPVNVAIPTGATQQFTATVTGTSNTNVNWSVNGIAGGNATVGTITSGGLYTAPAAIPNPASVTISAASQANLAVTTSASATVYSGKYRFLTIDYPGAYGYGTQTNGTNDSGQIVGSYYDSTFGEHGFLLSGGAYTSFDPPGSISTQASGINSSGQIVGFYLDYSGYSHAFLLSGGAYTSLDYPGSTFTRAFGISNSSQIVGDYANYTVSQLCFLLSGGVYSSFNFPDFIVTYASGINNSGQIVGFYPDSNESDNPHGFLLSGGIYTSFDYPGAAYTEARGINNSGQIVGFYDDSGGGHEQGFLLNGAAYTSFKYPGAVSTEALGINNSGQIVGSYLDSSGLSHGFLATPVN